MSINLKKNQTISLKKPDSSVNESYSLNEVTIGLGWDINTGGGRAYDLDACAVLLENGDKLTSDSDIVYYGAQKHRSGKIWLTGDNVTGEGDSDDEQIIVKLDQIDSKYEKIVFYTSLYQGQSRGQQFGNINNAYIRAVDANGKEIARYSISKDPSLNNKRSLIFAEAYRYEGEWKLRALGEALDTDSYSEVANKFKKKSLFGW